MRRFSLASPGHFRLRLLSDMTLTARQQEVLSFLEEAQARGGVMPTTREIQEHFCFASQTAAVNHLRALERRGVIQRQRGKARAMSLVSQLRRERIVDVPIMGQIAAGMAQPADEHCEGVLSIDTHSLGLPSSARVFALRVRGDSMTGAQINDGDLVVLELRDPKHGDIVAAQVDGDTTLKRLIISEEGAFLHAENPNFPDLIPRDELVVQGVLVAIIGVPVAQSATEIAR
jgi:repressor LexA